MKGHLRERSSGRWAIVIDGRDPQSGKRKRRWYSFRGTKRQAQVECARLIGEMKNGTAIEPSRLTVAAFLDRWLDYIKQQVSPRTHERYGEIVSIYLVPGLGGVLLTKLQAMTISGVYGAALLRGRRNGGRLSPRTVHHIHRVLKQALGQAVRWQLLSRNPAPRRSTAHRAERNEGMGRRSDGDRLGARSPASHLHASSPGRFVRLASGRDSRPALAPHQP